MIQFLQTATLLIFPALVILGGTRDLISYRIPNGVSLALIAGFPLASLALGLPLPTAGLCCAVGAAGLVAGMAMFALRWIGGGDAKLFAAAALWLGWPAAMPFLAVTGLAGGALAVGLLAVRSVWLRPLVAAGPPWLNRLAEPGENVPYGLAIAMGALAAFPSSPFAAAFQGLV